jgi:hypothetical protein
LSEEEPTSLYDDNGYPLWMSLPLSWWFELYDEDALEFIKNLHKEDDC